MTCLKCGMPLGEAVRMGAEEHICPEGVVLGLASEPEPEPVDDE